jgi:F-type H+-transporting ATPase subunit delta
MNESTIGRNYAEALLALARKGDEIEEYGALISAIATAIRDDQTLRTFLESPKLAASTKIDIIEKALGKKVPRLFLRYIGMVIQKRRQMLIPEIASEYQGLLDAAENRLHATVTVAREPGEPERDALARHLSRLFGKRVVPHITTNPALLGGLIVKVGDTVIDGSVRKRLSVLKQKMLATASR